MEHVEITIVGGGPAGISTALFLAHAAPELTDRILVLEKAHYPRDKFCAGALGARADKLLGSIGVVVDTPSVWLDGIAFRAMGETVTVRDGAIGRVVRRMEFDHELAKVAERRGIRLRAGERVHEVRMLAEGAELTTAKGVLRTRVLVGADGVSSIVRRAFGFGSVRYHAQALEVDTEPAATDLPRDVLLFDVSNRALPGYYWDFPTLLGGRELVCRGVYLLKTGNDDARVEIQDVLSAELKARGLELGNYKKKRYAERGFDIASTLSRPGVLLVGEAAGIDPITGEGIAQAIQYGAVAGRYIADKLSARDVTFADFRAELGRTMIGRDLVTRTSAVALFYGPRRALVEQFLLDTPEFIRVGQQHFAGKRWSKRAVLSSAFKALTHSTRWASAKASGAGE